MSEEEHISKRLKLDEVVGTDNLPSSVIDSALSDTITPATAEVTTSDDLSLSSLDNNPEATETVQSNSAEITENVESDRLVDIIETVVPASITTETAEVALKEQPKNIDILNDEGSKINAESVVSELEAPEDFQITTESSEEPIDTIVSESTTTKIIEESTEVVNNDNNSGPSTTENNLIDAIDLALLNPDADLHFSSDDEAVSANIDLGPESDSDSSSSSESEGDDSDSNSNSDSDSSSDSGSDNEDVDEDDIKADGLSDDEDSAGPLRTKNEIVDVPVPVLPEDFIVTPQMAIEPIGTLLSVLDSTVVIKASVSGEFRVLDDKSVFCFGDRTLIGMLFETFGRVQAPMYTVRFKDPELAKSLKNRKGEAVYYVVSNASFIYTDNIKAIKGSDASNWHDEEIPIEEQEHSDDEKEIEQKSKLKAKKKGKKKTATQATGDEITKTESQSSSTHKTSAKANPRQVQKQENKQNNNNDSSINGQTINSRPNPRQQQYQQHQTQRSNNQNHNQNQQQSHFNQFNGANGMPPQFMPWNPNGPPPFPGNIPMQNPGGMFPLQPLPMDPRMYFPPPGNQPLPWAQQGGMFGMPPFQSPMHNNFVGQNQNQQHQQQQFQQQFQFQNQQNQQNFQQGNNMPQFGNNNVNQSNHNPNNNGYNNGSNNTGNNGQPPSTLNYE